MRHEKPVLSLSDKDFKQLLSPFDTFGFCWMFSLFRMKTLCVYVWQTVPDWRTICCSERGRAMEGQTVSRQLSALAHNLTSNLEGKYEIMTHVSLTLVVPQ